MTNRHAPIITPAPVEKETAVPQPSVDCVWDLVALLGEGPLWRDGALWFVDIKRHHVHRLDPATGARDTWQAPDQVGWVQPTAGGRWLAGLKTGLAWFDPDRGAFTPWFDPEPDMPGNRLNDSTVDAQGRLWFGSMDDGERSDSGRLYRLDPHGRAVVAGPHCPITNGPVASPDGKILYHVDTLARQVHRYDVSPSGDLSNGAILLEIPEGEGHPDGPTIDSEGCLWIGLYGGWGARRYSPAGELMQHVALPVANVTKIAFGGEDLRTAYATTASKQLDDAALAEQPLAGGLFSFSVSVPGLPASSISIGIPAV
ncbi:SMP-30/gluconolactonase/LRE family protein [Sphingomonas koreensis]|nr:SMP-30/gluconolactonase/LRE family protein [Sphingomonas koreensis]